MPGHGVLALTLLMARGLLLVAGIGVIAGMRRLGFGLQHLGTRIERRRAHQAARSEPPRERLDPFALDARAERSARDEQFPDL